MLKPSLLPAVERELTDYQGQSHLYEIIPFAYDDSFNLGMDLADLLGGPVGEAFKSLLTGGDIELDDLDFDDIGKALAELVAIPRRIMQAGGAKLVARMLGNAVRMAEVDGQLTKQHLAEPDARTLAYAGGNQRESFEALWLVLEVNYGPFLTDLWSAVSPHLSGLVGSLTSFGQGSLEPAETETESDAGEPTSTPAKSGAIK